VLSMLMMNCGILSGFPHSSRGFRFLGDGIVNFRCLPRTCFCAIVREGRRVERSKQCAMKRSAGPPLVVAVIASVGVILGFDNQPYGYYMLLRLFLCGASLFFIAGANLMLEDWQRWTLGGFAVLYNPLVPIRLGEKDLWKVLNVATVVFFWFVALNAKRKQEGATGKQQP
jgi:hypothetical protein